MYYSALSSTVSASYYVHNLFWYPIVSHYHPQRFSIDAVECYKITHILH